MRPVHVDGAIYVALGVIGSIASSFGSDEAAKWVEPFTLWVCRNSCFAVIGGLLALKMFRSQTYSEDVKEQGDVVKK